MAYHYIHRPWKARKPFYWIMLFELFGVVANLVISALSQPDNWRTTMWQIGFDNGFNSSPAILLYAYANHEKLPTIAFVWTQTLTDFNVAISVLSLFVLLSKLIAIIMRVYFPIIGLFVGVCMSGLFIASVAGQCGPDYADPRYPSHAAWYIAKSCKYAKPYDAYTDCLLSKGNFAAALYQLFLYLLAVVIASWSLWPNKQLDVKPENSDDEDGDDVGLPEASTKQWEMQPQQPPLSPMTPKTPHSQVQVQAYGNYGPYTYGPTTGKPLLSPYSPSAAATMTAAGYGGGNLSKVQSHQSHHSHHGITALGEPHGVLATAAAEAASATLGSPFTPRTHAFHILDRKLPLRHHS